MITVNNRNILLHVDATISLEGEELQLFKEFLTRIKNSVDGQYQLYGYDERKIVEKYPEMKFYYELKGILNIIDK